LPQHREKWQSIDLRHQRSTSGGGGRLRFFAHSRLMFWFALVWGTLSMSGMKIELSGCKVIRVPGQWACKLGLRLAWRFGISAIPPEVTPYMTGQCIMTTDRLRAFLGSEYETVMRQTVEEAFAESLAGVVPGILTRSPER
jgi:hypothetical protein